MSRPWSELGIDRTTDVPTIRKAYAERLKKINPEDDEAGFLRLRTAYEHALALAEGREPPPGSEDADPGDAALERPPASPEDPERARQFVARFDALRHQDHAAEAVAELDALMRGQPLPSLQLAEEIERLLFLSVVPDPATSPTLLKDLAARFGWRRSGHRLATDHTEIDDYLKQRLAAEDWLGRLDAMARAPAAQTPGTPESLARLALSRYEQIVPTGSRPGETGPLLLGLEQAARQLLQQISQQDQLVAYRFDPRTLAWMRQEIEPRPATAPRPKPTEPSRFALAMVSVGLVLALFVIGVVVVVWFPSAGTVTQPTQIPARPPTADTSADGTIDQLIRSSHDWIHLTNIGDKVEVDFSGLLKCRGLIAEIRYSLDSGTKPDTSFDFPASSAAGCEATIPDGVTAKLLVPRSSRMVFVTLLVRFKNGRTTTPPVYISDFAP